MNIYKIYSVSDLIKGNPYVGRGIIIGKTPDESKAAIAYFIMGRSANSRNRIFVMRENVLYTEPFDPSKVEDPSLIIYAAIRKCGDRLIVTNGDQTDTICDGLKSAKTFSESLSSRCFEPDGPNFTPRISGILHFTHEDFTYEMSILKSSDPAGRACSRYTFSYPSLPGLGNFLHTYVTDGDPLPTFQGEPKRVAVSDCIEDFTNKIWNSLDEDNRISLFTRYVDLSSGHEEDRIINRNV